MFSEKTVDLELQASIDAVIDSVRVGGQPNELAFLIHDGSVAGYSARALPLAV
jgi:hypothetical protein